MSKQISIRSQQQASMFSTPTINSFLAALFSVIIINIILNFFFLYSSSSISIQYFIVKLLRKCQNSNSSSYIFDVNDRLREEDRFFRYESYLIHCLSQKWQV